jgi:signal transduction histidine kinase
MDTPGNFIALADHLRDRREALMLEWQRAVKRDPDLNQGESLPRAELFDHIPALLRAFEERLRHTVDPVDRADEPAAAHGLQRWQQGYDLREVIRELGQLNRCVILELDRFAGAQTGLSLHSMPRAREIWMTLSSATIEESVIQYFELQRQEAVGHVEDLERALAQIRELEQERGDLWRQAAHDLRGNLGVVANVAVGLTREGQGDGSREDFVRILTRNVTSLHHLLNDVTSLARLQAGRETRQLEAIDDDLDAFKRWYSSLGGATGSLSAMRWSPRICGGWRYGQDPTYCPKFDFECGEIYAQRRYYRYLGRQ